ncbi:MAG: dockerin type I domain-containing protein [Planctomycetota bacterium]
MARKVRVPVLVVCASLLVSFGPVPVSLAESPYAQWSLGPPTDPGYFPLGVWVQAPRSYRVDAFADAGINLYVGCSWDETEAGMNRLRNAGMKIILNQNGDYAPTHMDDDVICAWLQRDEPDNAKSNPSGGYYSPIAPLPTTTWSTYPGTDMYTRYLNLKGVDDRRPVFMNLGQGVAWNDWPGRGSRTGHAEDYPEYAQACDIICFDIYPAASGRSETAGKLWLVAQGVDHLVSIARPGQVVWNFVETTNISGNGQATPAEVKAEVWMSIVHGSKGILYFCHGESPDSSFDEQALLKDPVMLAAVGDINWQVRSLAPVINSPTVTGAVSTSSSSPIAPVDTLVKRHNGYTYVFSVVMRDAPTTVTYTSFEFPPLAVAEVIGEDRRIPVAAGSFSDDLDGFGVGLYKILSRFPGDADGNSIVDLDDFTQLKQNFGVPAGATWEDGDFNKDGAVDLDDFTLLKRNFGVNLQP